MLEIEFKTENAAFDSGYDEPEVQEYNKRTEVCRILRDIENKIHFGHSEGAIMDINGNKIGKWKLD